MINAIKINAACLICYLKYYIINYLFLLFITHLPSVSMKVIHGKSNIAMPVNPRNCQPADSAPALGAANNGNVVTCGEPFTSPS